MLGISSEQLASITADEKARRERAERKKLRDEFAKAALPACYAHVCAMLRENDERIGKLYAMVAAAAYEQADAMLAARSPKDSNPST